MDLLQLQSIKAGRNKFLKLRSILKWLLMFSKIPLLLDEKPKNQPFLEVNCAFFCMTKGGGKKGHRRMWCGGKGVSCHLLLLEDFSIGNRQGRKKRLVGKIKKKNRARIQS